MIDKLDHYAFTSIPSVYDEEALTALELAARTATKVNECVEKVNEVDESNKEAVAYMHDNIEETTEKVLTEKVANGEIMINMEYDEESEAMELRARQHAGGASYNYIAGDEMIDLI